MAIGKHSKVLRHSAHKCSHIRAARSDRHGEQFQHFDNPSWARLSAVKKPRLKGSHRD